MRFSVVSSNCGVTSQKVDQGQPVDSTNARTSSGKGQT